MKKIVILATLDTKLEETLFLETCIIANGCETQILDCSLRNAVSLVEDNSREDMMRISGISEKAFSEMEKADAHKLMQMLARQYVLKLFKEGKIQGAIGIGGVQGTYTAAYAIQTLPVGFPKMLLSTVANGNATFGSFVGMSDMVIMHSVVDIASLNPLLKEIIHNAAAAICGMVNAPFSKIKNKKSVAITMAGITTTCVTFIQDMLRARNYDVLVFHCNGVGAASMEELAIQGKLDAVMDISPHDVMDYLQSGLMPASDDRYMKLVQAGIPVLIAPGCADIILFNGLDKVPDKCRNRKCYEHNSIHTHVKADYSEMFELGSFICQRLEAVEEDTISILVPMKGFSQNNYSGGSIFDPDADRGFVDALLKRKNTKIAVKKIDSHINDFDFAEACVEEIVCLMEKKNERGN